MTEQEQIKALIAKGYNKVQATMIVKNKPKAQYGGIPYGVNLMPENLNLQAQTISPPQDFSNYYPTPTQVQTAQYQGVFGESGIPYYNFQPENNQQPQTEKEQEINRLNIINPYGGVDLSTALNYAGQGFGEKDPWRASIGTGLSLLKGTRNFMSGYSSGKSNRETTEDFYSKLFEDQRKTQAFQQGGVKNSEVLAMNAITDNPMGNTNLERGEFVKRTDGQVQPVVGEKHIKNGKKADGVDAQLNNGDKVLSDFIKLRPQDIKELKERYNISLKKGDTPAKALQKIEAKIGLKKEQEKLAETAEKLEKAFKIKDESTKELSIQALERVVATQNEKINALKEVSAVAFEEIFEAQEKVEKKDPTKLYDKNGKEVEDDDENEKEMSQQGGLIELATKYGISPERANELMSMQMGGEMVQGQEEKLMQMIVQLLEQGTPPEQIVEQLTQMGMSAEQATQAIQMVMQQSPQEQQMQQGGRISSKYEDPNLFIKQGATTEDWKTFGEILKTNPKEATAEIKRLHPELYAKFFVDGELPKSKVMAFQNAIDEKYSNILKDAEKVYGKDSQEVKNLQAQIEQDKFVDYSMENPSVRGRDNKFGNYTSTRPNFQLPILPKKELVKVREAGVNTASELKTKFPELYKQYVEPKGLTSDFWLGDITQTEPKPSGANQPQLEAEATPQVEPVINTRNVIPMLPNDLRLPPSGIPPLLKSEVSLGRIEPIKQTIEPYLSEQARQQLTAREQLSATGLPPQLQESLQAQNLASGQLSANDAISKVEQFNRGQQFQAEQFNIGQKAKEDIANQQFAQSYQDKSLGSIANTERDYRAFINEGNMQNRANWQSIENSNLLNRLTPNYSYVPGVGVEYLNQETGNLASPSISPTDFDKMTPQQLEEYKQQIAMAQKKKIALSQK